MKNFEKYEDEIRKFKGDNFCKDFVIPHILKKDDCAGIYYSLNTWNNRQTSWTEYHTAVRITPDWQKVRIQNEKL